MISDRQMGNHQSINSPQRTVSLQQRASRRTDSLTSNSNNSLQSTPEKPQYHQHHSQVYRSYSTPMCQRQDSSGSQNSAFSSSLEGGYGDSGEGMSPSTFGGKYGKDVPHSYRPQSFDDAHGNKLRMPLDSKLGSGFDLDWQYDPDKIRKIIAQRTISPDHPCHQWLAAKCSQEKKTSA